MADSDEPKDTRGPAVIAMGGLIGGFKFYGPFETIDAALTELDKLLIHEACSVLLVQSPEDMPLRKAEQ